MASTSRWRGEHLRHKLEEASGPLTVVVWLLAIVVAGWMLFARSADRHEFLGLARAVQYEVSAPSSGAVEEVYVDLHDAVGPGEVLARLDDQDVLAQLAREQTRVEELHAELAAESVRLGYQEAGLLEDRRRFQIDEEQSRLDVLAIRVQVASDEVERERLHLEVERSRPLVEQGFLSQSEFDDLRLRHDALARSLEENRRLLTATELELETATARRVAFDRTHPGTRDAEPLLAPFREAIRGQLHRVEELELARRRLTLRSPIAGRVSQVLAGRGQFVQPGEPLLRVTEAFASEVVGYAPEHLAASIHDGERMLAMPTDGTASAEALVVRSGAAIEETPQRLWRNPNVAEYGRPFVVGGLAGLSLLPGQRVALRSLDAP